MSVLLDTMCPFGDLYLPRFQLVTRSTPFPKLTNFNVMIQVSDGLRPEKPRHFEAPGLTPEVWEIAEMCWHEDPKKRPDAHTVLRHLEDLASSGTRTYIRTHTSAEGLLAGVRKGTYNGREVAIKSIRGGTPADNVACLKRNVRYTVPPAPNRTFVTCPHRFSGDFVKRWRCGCR